MFTQEFENQILEKLNLLLDSDVLSDCSLSASQKQELLFCFRSSEFFITNCLKNPQWVRQLIETGLLDKHVSRDEYLRNLENRVSEIDSFAELAIALRQYRYEQTLRIVWRDLHNKCDVSQTLFELSWLADACIKISVRKLMSWAVNDYGQPLDRNGNPIHLVILAMGKLGAEELNFSSDIDLIFTYKEDGEIASGQKSQSHGEFFVRLCQQLVKLLSEVTAYGFVYRVDTRLRPFGNSGQLALSFDAIESYYERHGREWERYAMVKARAISEDPEAAAEQMQLLQPFVYRRYLDFSSFASLREMKQLIDTEVSRKGAEKNVKLGPGGIREIEFIGQAFQLIRGGRNTALKERSILKILQLLNEMDILPEFVQQQLHDAYLFLRKTENCLQAFAEKQTHVLPEADLEKLRIAYSLGFSSWSLFEDELNHHMQNVHEHFEQIFSAPQLDSLSVSKVDRNDFEKLWLGLLLEEQAKKIITNLGYAEAKTVFSQLNGLRESAKYKTMGQNGKQRVDSLIPMLIPMVAKVDNPDVCLLRVIRLLEAIVKRTAYIALLAEHPLGLSQLVKLFDKSSWVANLLVIHPLLMDELIDPRRLYEPMSKDDLFNEWRYSVDTKSLDLEQKIQRLIEFKQSNFLRVAASELTDVMPVAKVSDHLTYIAEVVIDAVSEFAKSELSLRHGEPYYKDEEEKPKQAGFCVIAYGKLGGIELGFGSDLDLVFLHDSHGAKQETDGEKSIDNAVYFAKLGQKIILYLNTPTQSGKLYEVDMRLRPSGGAGALVSSLKSFFDYQQNKAWTWEHQALVRARFVSGDVHLKREFETIRKTILCQPRNENSLKEEVKKMRERMRDALLKCKAEEFDIKQSTGGITDIEFIIQFLVLRWANDFPEIIKHTDNIRILESLVKNKLLSEDNAKMLRDAYLTYRHTAHQYALQSKSTTLADGSIFESSRTSVKRLWQDIIGPDQ